MLVKLHTPLSSFTKSATPGASYFPTGVSICLVGKKSPVICTFCALGALRRKVTVWLAFTSGDTTGTLSNKACCAKLLMLKSKAVAKNVIFFIMMLLEIT